MRIPRTSLIVLAATTATLGAASYADAAAWSPPVSLDAPVRSTVESLQLATTPEDTAVAVWRATGSKVDATDVVWMARQAADGTWGDAVDLSGESAGASIADVSLAIGDDGTTVVAWVESDRGGTSSSVRMARRGPRDASWTTTSYGVSASEIDATVGPGGRIAVAWVERPGAVTVARYSGGSWSTFETPFSGSARAPRLAYTKGGKLVLASVLTDSSTVGVAVRGDSGWTTPSVPSDVSGTSGAPDVATGADGSVAIAWPGTEGAHDRALVAVYGDGAGLVTRPVSDGSVDAIAPQVAPTPDGFVAAWGTAVTTSGTTTYGVQTARSGRDGSWDEPEDVAGNILGEAQPDLAVAPDGSTTVVWAIPPFGPRGSSIVGGSRTRDADGTWEPVRSLPTPKDEITRTPVVAAYDDGSFTALWEQQRDADGGSGPQGGGEKLPQTSVLDRTPPAVDATPPASATVGVPLELSAIVTDRWTASPSVQWTVTDGPTLEGTRASWTPTTAGDHTIRLRVRDAAGNETVRTFVVHVTDPSADAAPAVTTAADATSGPPAATPLSCDAQYLELVGIQPRGTARAPRVRLSAVAGASLVGRTVDVRRNGRRVGTAKVRADRSVVATVAAPRSAKARSQARYRLIAGSAHSRALKATRSATISRSKTLAGGRVAITGRLGSARHVTTLVITGTAVCGTAATTRRTVRTDARGRFRVTLAPAGQTGSATVFRIAPRGARTVTLPVVAIAR